MTDIGQTRPFTVARLAAHWEVSEWMVYDMLQDGRLKGFKLGGKLWRIPVEEVQRCENGGDTPLMDTSSDSSRARPSSRGGKGARGVGSGSASTLSSKAELRLIASPDAKPQ